MVNNCIHLVGVITRDLRELSDKFITISIAVEKKFNDNVYTDYFTVKIFGEVLCMKAKMQLKKGSPVYIQGSLASGSYEKDGIKKYETFVKADEFHVLG
jgi:single-stranded DNA-binding protein